MLEFIRNHKRLTQIILLVFIIPSFIFVGVEGFKRFGDGDAVAKVAGKSITQQEWDNAQREQAERLRQRAPLPVSHSITNGSSRPNSNGMYCRT